MVGGAEEGWLQRARGRAAGECARVCAFTLTAAGTTRGRRLLLAIGLLTSTGAVLRCDVALLLLPYCAVALLLPQCHWADSLLQRALQLLRCGVVWGCGSAALSVARAAEAPFRVLVCAARTLKRRRVYRIHHSIYRRGKGS